MLKVYVSTFNKKCYNLMPYMVPIEVGAAGRSEFLYDLHDDSGDNISEKNEYYGELTGLYWIWKNSDLQPEDYIGFYHYNKHFDLNESEITSKMKDNDFIVLYNKVEKFISLRHNQRFYDQVAEEYCPDFYRFFKEAIQPTDIDNLYTSGGNMMITTKKNFDEYYSFLFPMLDRLKELTGEDDSSPYYKRYIAFFAEQAFLPYLKYKNYRFASAKIKFVGPFSWKVNTFLIRVINKLLPFDFAQKHDMYIRRSSFKK